jgi:hypothetical protein
MSNELRILCPALNTTHQQPEWTVAQSYAAPGIAGGTARPCKLPSLQD